MKGTPRSRRRQARAVVGCAIAECDENGILVDLLRDFRPDLRAVSAAHQKPALTVGPGQQVVPSNNPLSLHKTIKHAMCARRKRVSLLFHFLLLSDLRPEEAAGVPAISFVELSSKSATKFDRSRSKKLGSVPGWLRKLECLYEAPVVKVLLSALQPTPQVRAAHETSCTFILNLASEDEQTESYLDFSQLLLEKQTDLEQLTRSLRLMVSKKKSGKTLLGEEQRKPIR